MFDPPDKPDSPSRLASQVQDSIAQDVVYLSVGTILSQVILIVAILLLARIYTPQSFGLLGIASAVMMVLGTLMPMKYESAIMLDKSDTDAEATTQLALLSAFILSLVLLPIFLIVQVEPCGSMLLGSVNEFAGLLILGALGLAVATVVIAWLNRLKCYKLIALAKVVQSLIFVVGALIFIQNDLTNGLIYSQLIAYILVAVVLFLYVAKRQKLASRDRLLNVSLQHIAAPKFVLPTALLDVLTQQLPMLLIPIWFSTELAGQFGMAWRVVILPLSLVGVAIGQIFYQRFAVSIDSPVQAQRFLLKTWVSLFTLAIFPSITLAFWGEDIFVSLLGSSWEEAGTIAQIFSVLLLAMFVSSPTSSTFLVLGLQKFSLLFGIAQLIYRPIALLAGFIFQSFTLGISLFVVFEVVQIMTYQALAYWTLKKRVNLSMPCKFEVDH